MATLPSRKTLVEEYRAEADWRTERFQKGFDDGFAEGSTFAQVMIQSTLLLHGGALLGLTPVLSALGVQFAEHILTLTFMAVGLAFGIGASLIAGVAGFFAVSNYADHSGELVVAEQHRAWESVYLNHSMSTEASRSAAAAVPHEASARGLHKSYIRCRMIGIASLVFSLVAFVAIAITAIWLLTTVRVETAKTSEMTVKSREIVKSIS
jgi:hypothetical protein